MKRGGKIIIAIVIIVVLAASAGITVAVLKNKKNNTPPVVDVTLESIAISGYTATFEKGTDFSTGDITVTATYSDDSTKTISIADCTVDSSNYRKSVAGQYSIDVAYGGKTATYTVAVIDSQVLYELTVVGGTAAALIPQARKYRLRRLCRVATALLIGRLAVSRKAQVQRIALI